MSDGSNPWLAVPLEPPYLLTCDVKEIHAYNKKHPNECFRVQDKVLPEPFIGEWTAPVVLLNLNPGFEDRDVRDHARPEFQTLIRNNYRPCKPQIGFSGIRIWSRARCDRPSGRGRDHEGKSAMGEKFRDWKGVRELSLSIARKTWCCPGATSQERAKDLTLLSRPSVAKTRSMRAETINGLKGREAKQHIAHALAS